MKKEVAEMRVLIAEDEVRLAQALRQIVLGKKYLVDVVDNGQDALEYAMSMQYDVLILDVMLPKLDGFEVARQLRNAKNPIPILMLTARDTVADKVRGLNCGADDYMTKPFSAEELLARLHAMTRRQGEVIMEELQYEDISLNLQSSQLCCGQEHVQLNFKEFAVMKLLLSNQGRIVTKDLLIANVWGLDSDAADNNVEAYISFLRRKLKFIGSRVTIRNRKKLGYVLEVASC